MRVQMLGLCRFSYLGGRGFQVDHQSMEERRAFLYDPERLARRWFWFENVTLPGLMAQTDGDFTLVLMTGPDLPEPWMGKLQALCEAMPQARLSVVQPMRFHLPACWAAVRPHIDPQAEVIGHFRQDDDDAVAIDYIARARRDFMRLRPIYKMQQRVSLDYMRGLVLKATGNGVSVEPRMIHNAVAALTLFLPPDAEATGAHFPHWRLAHHMPGVTLGDRIMYCRFLNHDNDSGAVGAGYDYDESPGDLAVILRDRFRIDLAAIDRAARDFNLPAAPRPNWGAV